jgi:hypothetical protein
LQPRLSVEWYWRRGRPLKLEGEHLWKTLLLPCY